MICRRARRAVSAVERSWCRAAVLATWVILIGVVSVPTASAGLVKEAADAVGSTVRSVQAGPNAVPLLPSTSPPAAAPAPAQAETPAPPPQAPAQEPSPPPSKASAGAVDPPPASAPNPPVDRVGGAAQSVVDSVTSTGNEAASRAATSERNNAPPATAPSHRLERGASEAATRERRKASSPPLAVRPAEVAALQRWLAYVWPAVPLGGSGVIGAGVAGVVAEDLFGPALAAVTGVLLASSPILAASGDAPLAGHHGVAGASRSAPHPAPVPAAAEGGNVLYMIAMVGLLAVLAFTVWREFRIALHPGVR
jgi:hypothetical protein